MEPLKQLKARKTETVRDTTLSIRTTKRLKALAEVAALAQEKPLFLSTWLEQLIQTSFDNVLVDRRDEGEANSGGVRMTAGRPLSVVADELYDDDDVTCLFKRLYRHPWALSQEQRRVLKLIEISPVLHPKQNAYVEQNIREHWAGLNAVANEKAPVDILPIGLFGNTDVQFALMTEKEQVAIYRTSKDEFFRRSKTHLTKARAR